VDTSPEELLLVEVLRSKNERKQNADRNSCRAQILSLKGSGGTTQGIRTPVQGLTLPSEHWLVDMGFLPLHY
jgi:hypothetical protein